MVSLTCQAIITSGSVASCSFKNRALGTRHSGTSCWVVVSVVTLTQSCYWWRGVGIIAWRAKGRTWTIRSRCGTWSASHPSSCIRIIVCCFSYTLSWSDRNRRVSIITAIAIGFSCAWTSCACICASCTVTSISPIVIRTCTATWLSGAWLYVVVSLTCQSIIISGPIASCSFCYRALCTCHSWTSWCIVVSVVALTFPRYWWCGIRITACCAICRTCAICSRWGAWYASNSSSGIWIIECCISYTLSWSTHNRRVWIITAIARGFSCARTS